MRTKTSPQANVSASENARKTMKKRSLRMSECGLNSTKAAALPPHSSVRSEEPKGLRHLGIPCHPEPRRRRRIPYERGTYVRDPSRSEPALSVAKGRSG